MSKLIFNNNFKHEKYIINSFNNVKSKILKEKVSDFHFPEYVEVSYGNYNGRVRVSHDKYVKDIEVGNIFIKDVNCPEIFIKNNDDYNINVIEYLFCHELSHYYELNKRKVHNINFPNILTSVLWSEYFAHRFSLRVLKNQNILQEYINCIENNEVENIELNVNKDDNLSNYESSESIGKLGYYLAWYLAEYNKFKKIPANEKYHELIQAVEKYNYFNKYYISFFKNFSCNDEKTKNKLSKTAYLLKNIIPAKKF